VNSQNAPFSEGLVSSFDVQKATLSIIRTSPSASTEKALAGSLLGRVGNSSVGIPTILNLLLRERIEISSASAASLTSASLNSRTISANRFAGSVAAPPSST